MKQTQETEDTRPSQVSPCERPPSLVTELARQNESVLLHTASPVYKLGLVMTFGPPIDKLLRSLRS